MQDTVIKGTGNSRSLASVPNFLALYPTYEAFAQALVNREIPIDIGPLNPLGCDVVGTPLDAATLSEYGKIATGSYVGNGGYGSSYKNEIILPFEPYLVIIKLSNDFGIYVSNSTSMTSIISGDFYSLYVSVSGTTLSWWHGSSNKTQLNMKGSNYVWVALGQ